jgi:hypothetical protein
MTVHSLLNLVLDLGLKVWTTGCFFGERVWTRLTRGWGLLASELEKLGPQGVLNDRHKKAARRLLFFILSYLKTD